MLASENMYHRIDFVVIIADNVLFFFFTDNIRCVFAQFKEKLSLVNVNFHLCVQLNATGNER